MSGPSETNDRAVQGMGEETSPGLYTGTDNSAVITAFPRFATPSNGTSAFRMGAGGTKGSLAWVGVIVLSVTEPEGYLDP
jgi:hypothetical protein